MTSASFGKLEHRIVKSEYPKDYRLLLEADIAYRRGNPNPAMELWKNTADTDSTKLTVASLVTPAAISAGNFRLYGEIPKNLQGVMEKTTDNGEIALLSLPQTLASVSMGAVSIFLT